MTTHTVTAMYSTRQDAETAAAAIRQDAAIGATNVQILPEQDDGTTTTGINGSTTTAANGGLTSSGSPAAQMDANAQNNAIAYGVATGLGVDIGLLPNVFLRGELEYVYLAPVNGIQVSVSSARVGAGVKF